MSKRSCPPSLVFGADGLRSVLDNKQVVTIGHLHNCVHLGNLSIEMNGDNGARSFGDGAFDFRRIDIERERVYVYKDILPTKSRDRSGGREESVRRGYDLVAWL